MDKLSSLKTAFPTSEGGARTKQHPGFGVRVSTFWEFRAFQDLG